MAFPTFSARAFGAALAACAVSGAFLPTIAPAVASETEAVRQPLKVQVDRAKVVRIAKAADTIVVGNPSVVDATIQDSRTLVLTGRAYGVTNLIVLDSNGDPIVDETVVVQGHSEHTVRIYRRGERETLACAPLCEPALTVGDDLGRFEPLRDMITKHQGLAREVGQEE